MASPVHVFSGHETFPFRYPWLKKGFDAVRQDGNVFLRDDAITTLGVGKNMVRSIRHWCLAAGVLEEDRAAGGMRATRLGKLLFADRGLDPYLEDPATLWILHWQIASNRWRATTWFSGNRLRRNRKLLPFMIWHEIQAAQAACSKSTSLAREVSGFAATRVE